MDTAPSQATSSPSRPAVGLGLSVGTGDGGSQFDLSPSTRRRLVKKPLPEAPQAAASPQANSKQLESISGDAAERGKELQNPSLEETLNEDTTRGWWPTSLPSTGPGTQSYSSSNSLDHVCRAHLRKFVQRALYGSFSQRLGDAASDAIIEALESIIEPSVLEGVQRTACVRWRAEAQLRAQSNNDSNSGQAAISRWGRLGWPATAFRNMIQPQGNMKTSQTGSDWRSPNHEAAQSDTHSNIQRVRKRDIALSMLSNAAWLVAHYAVPEQSTSHGSHAANIGIGCAAQYPASRRERGVVPAFINAPAPTTALSSESISLESTVSREPSPSRSQSALSNVPGDEAASWTSLSLSRPSSPDATRPKRSQAVEKLAQLNASIPSSCRSSTDDLRENQPTSAVPSVVPKDGGTKSHSSSPHPPEQSPKKDIDGLADSKKMSLPIFMLDFVKGPRKCLSRDEEEWYGSLQSAKSDRTIGPYSPNKEGRIASSSSIDTSSSAEGPPSVKWLPGCFTGETLYSDSELNVQDLLHEEDESSNNRLRKEGGTFQVKSVDPGQKQLLKHTLAAGLYIASTMFLETMLLEDSGAARPGPIKETPAEASVDDHIMTGDSLESSQSAPGRVEERCSPSTDAGASHTKRWTKGLWNVWQTGSDALSAAFSVAKSSDSIPASALKHGVQPVSMVDAESEDRVEGMSSAKPSSPLNKRKLLHLGLRVASRSRIEKNRYPSNPSCKAPVSSQQHTVEPESASAVEPSSELQEFEENGVPQDLISSTSPETSHALLKYLPRRPDFYGLAYLEWFSHLQSLAVLVTGQETVSPDNSFVVALPPGPSQPSSRSHYSGPTAGQTSSRSVSLASSIESSNSRSSVPSMPSFPRADQISSRRRQHGLMTRREEVEYYKDVSPGKDLQLGHVIEDLCARTEMTFQQSDNKVASLQAAPYLAASTQFTSSSLRCGQNGATLITYLHGNHRITLMTRLLPKESPAQHEQAATSDSVLTPPGTKESRSELKDDSDVDSVANAMQTSHDAAQAALALAGRAIDASEGKSGSSHQLNSDSILMWTADLGTNEQSQLRIMSQGTWLLSFAKYLETLVYNPHFSGQEQHSPSDPRSEYDVVRLFQRGRAQIKFTVGPLRVYDLQTEGPVIPSSRMRHRSANAASLLERASSPALNSTRIEIQAFYASVKELLSNIESVIVARNLDQDGRTIRQGAVLSSHMHETSETSSDEASSTSSSKSHPEQEPLELLARLQARLRRDEFQLYDALKAVRPDCLNDLRKAFKECSRSAKHRLSAWRQKHLSAEERASFDHWSFSEPSYLLPRHHAFPGSKWIVREDEPLSIIAFSLSSREYKGETSVPGDSTSAQGRSDSKDADAKWAQVLDWRASIPDEDSGNRAESIPSLSSSADITPSMRSAAGSDRSRNTIGHGSANASVSTDPDHDGWCVEQEAVVQRIKRKRRGRDASILALTLRRVGSTVSTGSESLRSHAWTFSDLPPNDSDVHDAESVKRLASSGLDSQTLETLTPRGSSIRPASSAGKYYESTTISSSSGTHDTFRAHITQVSGRPASLASVFSRDTASDATASVIETPAPSNASVSDTGVKDSRAQGLEKDHGNRYAEPRKDGAREGRPPPALSSTGTAKQVESPHVKHTLFQGSTKISCVSWFAEQFATLRDQWGITDEFVESLSACKPWQATGGKSRSVFFKSADEKWIGKQLRTIWSVDEKDALLEFAPAYIRYMLNSEVNDCPTLLVKIAGFYSLKIKDIKTGETRLKMSIMVIENLFADTEAQDALRFDLKGIRDRRATNTYTSAKAAVHSPGLGSSTDKSPRSIQVPLFSSDAKLQAEGDAEAKGGRSTRQVDPVLWDADWIDQYQHKAFVGESEQRLFTRALQNDLAFLTGSNVMDFSLLAGVCESSKRPFIRVRIVDYISAFTLAKQLESSSKKALKASAEARGNVTVLPPAEYAARFESAMLSYFTGVPDSLPDRLSRQRLDESLNHRGETGGRSYCGLPSVF